MRQISNLSAYRMAKVGTRVFCKACKKETAFFRSKCLECGLECGLEYHRAPKGPAKRQTWRDGLAQGRKLANVRDDKRDYWKKKAEESRAKFEGAK